MTKRPPCPLHFRWRCSGCNHLKQQQNRKYDPTPRCAKCGGTAGIEIPTIHHDATTRESCVLDAERPLEVRREPENPDMISSLLWMLEDVRSLLKEHQGYSAEAFRNNPEVSPWRASVRAQNLNKADDTAERIATLVRSWAHRYPAPWLADGAFGAWCPHGKQVVVPDPSATDDPFGKVVAPWPCKAYGCSLAEYERMQEEEAEDYWETTWQEAYGE